MMSNEIYKKLTSALHEHKNIALITIINHPEKFYISRKYLLYSNGQLFEGDNLSSDVQIEIKIKEKCLPILKNKQTKTIYLSSSIGEIECFVESFLTPAHLIVAGAGHVSEPVAEMGKMLGFYVTVIDDREEFANTERFPDVDEVACMPYIDFFRNVAITPDTYILLLTRGHQFDVISLQELLTREEAIQVEERTAYIGMIGSRRRIAGVFDQLKDQFTEHNFVNIYSPVGLDIGAETPAEIAVSILAEILKIKNETTGESLKGKIRSYSQLTFRERKQKKERVTK